MLVTDLLLHIRDGLGSAANSRWTDAELVRVAQVAVERSQAILQRNDISFGRKAIDIATLAGIANYDVPGDFAAVISMTRTDTAQPLRHISQSVAHSRNANAGGDASLPVLAPCCRAVAVWLDPVGGAA